MNLCQAQMNYLDKLLHAERIKMSSLNSLICITIFFNKNFVVSVLSNTLMFTIAFTISFYTYLVVFDRKKEDK